jgi:hypothetical protein
MTMEHYVGIDGSLESASAANAAGRIVRETKVAYEPEVLISWFDNLGIAITRVWRLVCCCNGACAQGGQLRSLVT